MASRQARRESRLARAEAQLRYGSQINALKRTRKDLLSGYRKERADYEAAGKMNEASAARAMPALQKAMSDFVGPVSQARSSALRQESNKLPDGLYKSILRAEATEAPARMAKTLGDAASELSLRRSNATIQAQQGAQGAYARMKGDRAKVTSELDDILNQSGVYKSTRVGELRTDRLERTGKRRQIRNENRREDAKERRRQREADSDDAFREEQARIRNTQAQARLDRQGKPGAAKKPTGARVESAISAIGYAKSVAVQNKSKGVERNKVATALVRGTADQTDPDTKKKKLGVKKTSELWASIGLDLAYDGHISRVNRSKLRKLGYSMGQLGLPKTPKRKPAGYQGAYGPPTPKR